MLLNMLIELSNKQRHTNYHAYTRTSVTVHVSDREDTRRQLLAAREKHGEGLLRKMPTQKKEMIQRMIEGVESSRQIFWNYVFGKRQSEKKKEFSRVLYVNHYCLF